MPSHIGPRDTGDVATAINSSHAPSIAEVTSRSPWSKVAASVHLGPVLMPMRTRSASEQHFPKEFPKADSQEKDDYMLDLINDKKKTMSIWI